MRQSGSQGSLGCQLHAKRWRRRTRWQPPTPRDQARGERHPPPRTLSHEDPRVRDPTACKLLVRSKRKPGAKEPLTDRLCVRSSTGRRRHRARSRCPGRQQQGNCAQFRCPEAAEESALSLTACQSDRLEGEAQAARAEEEGRVAPELGGSAGPSAEQAKPLAEVRTSQTDRLGLGQAQPCARRTPAEAESEDPAAARAKSEAPEVSCGPGQPGRARGGGGCGAEATSILGSGIVLGSGAALALGPPRERSRDWCPWGWRPWGWCPWGWCPGSCKRPNARTPSSNSQLPAHARA